MGETIGKLTREQQAVLGIQNAPWSLWKSPHLCLNVLFGQQWIMTTSWNKTRKLLEFVMWCCFCCLWLNITSWLHVYVFWREKVGWTLDEAVKKRDCQEIHSEISQLAARLNLQSSQTHICVGENPHCCGWTSKPAQLGGETPTGKALSWTNPWLSSWSPVEMAWNGHFLR